MKIAVLADIHSNFIALQEVYYHIKSWHPDFIIVAGDMVNRGPDPFDCVQFLHQKSIEDNWVLLTGNHEEYVIEKFENFDSLSEFERQLHKPSIWTGQKLKSEYQFIKSLPDKLKLVGPDLREVRIVHGSMLGSRDGIYIETPTSSLGEKITGTNTFDKYMDFPSAFCVGHTHRPFIKTYLETLIINVGSVGLSFDGDPRLAYAQLLWTNNKWYSKIIRLKYEYAKAEQNFHESGYLDEAGPLAKIVLTELQKSRSLLYFWASEYQEEILNGTISVEDSVEKFLSEISGGTSA